MIIITPTRSNPLCLTELHLNRHSGNTPKKSDGATPVPGSDTSSGKQCNRPTAEAILSELLFYFNVDIETGLITVKRLRHCGKPIGEVAPFSNGPTKYLALTICKKIIKVHQLIWIVAYGTWPTHEIDHIDRERTNNSIHNLRDVSQHLNQKMLRSEKTIHQANLISLGKRISPSGVFVLWLFGCF